MNKYASEPWYISAASSSNGDISICEGETIFATVHNNRDRAHLIAAAPVLYEFVLARAVAGDKDAVRVLQSLGKG